MPPLLDDNTNRCHPANQQIKRQAAWRHTTTPAKELDRSRALYAPGNARTYKCHHTMTTLADITLPIVKSNAKQLDVTPLPLPRSLTEADPFMPRATPEHINATTR